mmetsp:Transcript_45151/g.98166  ORF Transcript_45151/g.98166 Transcript_45151/m.98166 type:complete len:536 (-) Transcript_45151:118-1725(-)
MPAWSPSRVEVAISPQSQATAALHAEGIELAVSIKEMLESFLTSQEKMLSSAFLKQQTLLEEFLNREGAHGCAAPESQPLQSEVHLPHVDIQAPWQRASRGIGLVDVPGDELAKQWASARGYIRSGLPSKEMEAQFSTSTSAGGSRMLRVVSSGAFDTASAIVIFFSAAVLAVQTEYEAANLDHKVPEVLGHLQNICLAYFVLELCARVGFLRRDFFISSDWRWNIFDLCVVLVSVVDKLLIVLSDNDSKSSFSSLRLLRMLRLVRVVRVIRVVRFFKELRMMVYSVLASGSSLLWGVLLLTGIVFIFSINIVMDVTQHRRSGHSVPPRLLELFETLPLAMLTLFQSISGGINWREAAVALQDIEWQYSLYMAGFVAFNMLAVLNIITGVFVTGAIATAQNDTDLVIENELDKQSYVAKKILLEFSNADKDQSGFLDREEFRRHVENPRVAAYFRHLGLDVSEAWGLFRLLDTVDDGRVDLDEFIMGCMRLKGAAKGVDVATLLYENKRMCRVWQEFMKYCETEFTTIRSKLDAC